VTWTADSLGFVGDLDVNGATVVLDGSTSVRGISAAFTSLESPANRFGVNATEYISIATAATTGITTITHTGSAPAVTWTADSLSFVGDFDSNGATAILDGSTSTRLLSAGFNSLEAPNNRLGVNATIYVDVAVTDTTGVTAITHTGSAPTVTWTANSFDFVGAFAADAVTLSDVLTFSDAGTIDNTAADTLTITETNIVLEGIAKTNRIIIDDGDADVSIDSDNQTNATAAINIPDFVDATADFLVTNLFTVILPFHGGLAGEDTDAAGTNGGGMVGSTVDVTTHDYNSGAAGGDDVVCKVYDLTSTTWDDLSTAALLSAGADWAINYQLLPDADAEEAGDAFAVGFDEKFCEIVFNDLATNNGTLATWGGDGGKYQYSTGAGTWSDLTVFDNTDLTAQDGLRSLQRAGAITFVPPSDWVVATYDGEEAYWVQYVLTGAQLTQTPVIDDTNFDEPIVGIPTTDSFITPYKMSLAEVRVTNMGITVHDQAIEFIVGNFTDGTFSAALTWTASQYSDWFDLAAEIACDAGDIIGIMITDDGGSTVNPIWAVEFEVTYED